MSLKTPSSKKFQAGFAALSGRPNVGKSTLLNAILGEKLAAVTPKPQTTRERILGVKTFPDAQIAFVDTPGIHKARREINQLMVREAVKALSEVDAVVLVIDAREPSREEEELLLAELEKIKKPAILALNKIDKLPKKHVLLPLLDSWSKRYPFAALVPISALTGEGIDILLDELKKLMPEGPPLFPEDQFTDRPARFLVAELIREQVFLSTGEEIPYSSAVTIDRYEDPEERGETGGKPRAVRISATIHVERESQKSIVIGHKGQMLKKIGSDARREIEALLGKKVFLELFVRVEPNWSRNPRAIRKLGIGQT